MSAARTRLRVNGDRMLLGRVAVLALVALASWIWWQPDPERKDIVVPEVGRAFPTPVEPVTPPGTSVPNKAGAGEPSPSAPPTPPPVVAPPAVIAPPAAAPVPSPEPPAVAPQAPAGPAPGGPLSALIPQQVGRFQLTGAERQPPNPSIGVTDFISATYLGDRGEKVGLAIAAAEAPGPCADDAVRFHVSSGFPITGMRYGRNAQGEVVRVTRVGNSERHFLVWSSGQQCHDVGAFDEAVLDEFFSALPFAPRATVTWMTSPYAGFAQAIRDGKPLVAYFYFKTCKNCRLLEDGVLASPAVNQRAADAVFVQVDIESDDQNKNVSRLTKELGLTEYPVVALLDCSSAAIAERGRVVGYFPLEVFAPRLDDLFRQPKR